MKIHQLTDNSLYVYFGDYVYYFDDSIDGESTVHRWHRDNDIDAVRNLGTGIPLFADEETLQKGDALIKHNR